MYHHDKYVDAIPRLYSCLRTRDAIKKIQSIFNSRKRQARSNAKAMLLLASIPPAPQTWGELLQATLDETIHGIICDVDCDLYTDLSELQQVDLTRLQRRIGLPYWTRIVVVHRLSPVKTLRVLIRMRGCDNCSGAVCHMYRHVVVDDVAARIIQYWWTNL